MKRESTIYPVGVVCVESRTHEVFVFVTFSLPRYVKFGAFFFNKIIEIRTIEQRRKGVERK